MKSSAVAESVGYKYKRAVRSGGKQSTTAELGLSRQGREFALQPSSARGHQCLLKRALGSIASTLPSASDHVLLCLLCSARFNVHSVART